jgi:hypothetical protein
MIPLSKEVDYFSRPYHHKTIQEALAHARLNLDNIKRHRHNARYAKDASKRFEARDLACDDRIHFYTIRKCALALPINNQEDRDALEEIQNLYDKAISYAT